MTFRFEPLSFLTVRYGIYQNVQLAKMLETVPYVSIHPINLSSIVTLKLLSKNACHSWEVGTIKERLEAYLARIISGRPYFLNEKLFDHKNAESADL